MVNSYKLRYEGDRWKIIYGKYEGIEQFAVSELQRMVQSYLPYVIETCQTSGDDFNSEENLILLGTAADNSVIAELIKRKLLSIPKKSQGYTAACIESPFCEKKKIIVIAGHDSHGVLYGVEDFNSRILAAVVTPDESSKMREAFDGIEKFSFSEYPLIENRGIWSWGYVIYDYRRFIDNMARLKMNMLTIWNDYPPINCKEVIDYAHSRAVKIILGFHWGWGMKNIDLSNKEHRQQIKEEVLSNYKKNYKHLGMDGIYFQTLTEHHDTEVSGKTTASLVCELVNDISRDLLDKEPDLHIQFGLHATSIMNSYNDLKPLNPKITIVWEDVGGNYKTKGVIPYSYLPIVDPDLNKIEECIDYSKKIAVFRGKKEFAMAPKGFIWLRWGIEFEHHKSFILGERDKKFIQKRLVERQALWDKVNTLWLKNYPIAKRYYREMLDCSLSKMTVTGLIEDGMFEESIQISVAIFAETLWNPKRSDEEILQLSMSPYYKK